jgi:hypothetical protein
VLERGTLVGPDVRGVPMPRSRSVDVHEPFELAFGEFLLLRGVVHP